MVIKYHLKWIRQQYYRHLSYWHISIQSTINDQLLSFISINDMIVGILLSSSRRYYHILPFILHLSFFSILLLLLPYVNGENTDIPIANVAGNSGNAGSVTNPSLSSLSDDILNVREPIKNIIGGILCHTFSF